MANSVASDEALARRLQAQEMGFSGSSNPDVQTPLMVNYKFHTIYSLIKRFGDLFYRIETMKIQR